MCVCVCVLSLVCLPTDSTSKPSTFMSAINQQTEVNTMLCLVCEKWAEISMRNQVHQMWIKAPLKKKDSQIKKIYCLVGIAYSTTY